MKIKSNNHIYAQKDDGEYQKKLCEEVMQDFLRRQKERKTFESQWQLNMNFLMGNQYCSVGHSGEIEVFYFSSGDITSDEVVFETQNDITESLAKGETWFLNCLKRACCKMKTAG